MVAEAQDAKCYRLVRAVLAPAGSYYRGELQLPFGGEEGKGMILLDEVSLRPAFRGYHLDRVAVWHTLRWLGAGRPVAVFRPVLREEETGEEGPAASTSEEAFAQRQEKLAAYWGEMGFQPVSDEAEDYYYLNLDYLPGHPPTIRRRRFHGEEEA